MGVCCSSKDNADKEIEDHMLKQNKSDRAIKKLLLLGSGSSGKSTLFKQLKCIFSPWGLESNEFAESMHAIRSNIVQSMLKLLIKSQALYDSNPDKYNKCFIDLSDTDNNQHTLTILKYINLLISFRHDTFENLDDQKWDQMQKLGLFVFFLLYIYISLHS